MLLIYCSALNPWVKTSLSLLDNYNNMQLKMVYNALKMFRVISQYITDEAALERCKLLCLSLALPGIIRPEPNLLGEVNRIFRVNFAMGQFSSLRMKAKQVISMDNTVATVSLLLDAARLYRGAIGGNGENQQKDWIVILETSSFATLDNLTHNAIRALEKALGRDSYNG